MLVKENKTFDDLSIVTMCFDMGMEGLAKVKGDVRGDYYNYYIKSVIKLCHFFYNVIVFCDYECAKYLEEEKKKYNLKIYIFCMSFDELEKMRLLGVYTETYDKMKNQLVKKSIQKNKRSVIIKKDAEVGDLAKYTVLNHSKTDLMYKASQLNPFQTEYFYWLDGGCTHQKYEAMWKDWDGTILRRPKAIRCSLHMRHWTRIRCVLWTRRNLAYCFCEDQMAATFWGGERKYMEELKKLFDETVESFIMRKLITSEQGIFTWMIKKYPFFFEVVQSNHYDRIIYNVANSPGRKL